jgi:hypothetical protein
MSVIPSYWLAEEVDITPRLAYCWPAVAEIFGGGRRGGGGPCAYRPSIIPLRLGFSLVSAADCLDGES